MGDVIGDLNSRRGQVGELGDKPGGMKTVKSFVPLAEMFKTYSTLPVSLYSMLQKTSGALMPTSSGLV